MGFEHLGDYGLPAQLVWMPIDDADTLYMGQIVKQSAEGVAPLGAASGNFDTTNKAVPFGVVTGFNLTTETFDTTYNAARSVDPGATAPHGSTTDYATHTGPYSKKGDRVAMAQIALIKPGSVIRGHIFNAAYGTAPTVGTVSTGSTTGLGATSSAVDSIGVATLSTVYFRTGANAGIYRITDDASTTVMTWDKAVPSDIAIGDTLVRINLRMGGLSHAQLDAESTYIECSANVTAGQNYYGILVTKLDLSTAGNEYVNFMFAGDHFCPNRA